MSSRILPIRDGAIPIRPSGISATARHRNRRRYASSSPEGTGIAIATHDYKHCGAYHAVCVVTDNDGASGEAAITVRVVDVVNCNFEDGFRIRTAGAVANGWEPYVGSAPAGNAFAAGSPSSTAGTLFAGEEIVVHNGRRSQRIAGLGTFVAGIYQRVGTNIGWDYQVTAWYSLDERGGGTCLRVSCSSTAASTRQRNRSCGARGSRESGMAPVDGARDHRQAADLRLPRGRRR